MVLKLSGVDLYDPTSLSQNNFAEHISFLSNLKDLDLYDCGLCGPVFPIQEFNNLSRLFSLNMGNNYELNSPFPVHLANLTSLSSLHLSYCNLHGSVPYMPQLRKLDVAWNPDLHVDLTRTFEHRWPKLISLRMYRTKVTGPFVNLISNVPLLETLYASDCSIQGPIPKSICEISFLRDIYLDNNNLTGIIPSCITMLGNLNQLDISNNSIQGNLSLPFLISKLNLTVLNLSSNKLTVNTDQHLNLYHNPKLEVLRLESCNLKGLFPAFICDLTHLEILELSRNNLTGTIPSCIYKLKTLSVLDFSHNNLYGPLPLPSKKAVSYNVARNKFNGEISIEFGKKLSTLSVVLLSDNELTGTIPFSICSKQAGLYSNIRHLHLSNNKLSGIIPTSIGYCKSLLSLNLATNNLTGNVPKELEQANNMLFLQLNDNNLDGAPLYFISKLFKLVVLNLGNNKFGGSISDVFGSLNDLWILSLRSNNFSGSIPEEIVDLHQLGILDLSGNKLKGLIPREIGKLRWLISRSNDTYSFGGNNQADLLLQMGSKGALMQYEKLYAYSSGIDLSSNNLEGEIPEEIGQLKGLSMLSLSHNRLSGNIPLSVGRMNGLESLDLSFNKLSGDIPLSLALMDFLSYLNLSYNNLSGIISRGPHFDTLGGDGSAYVNNTFLCGYLTKKNCNGEESSGTGNTSSSNDIDEDDSIDTWYFYGVVALGFIVGFWGFFFGLLLKKQKWWFGYWRLVDILAVKIIRFLSE